MLSTVERQNQPQAQQLLQQTQQVSNMPATYHVPRGPAAVANISAPRSTVATPIVRANTGQTIPTTRPGYIYYIIFKRYIMYIYIYNICIMYNIYVYNLIKVWIFYLLFI